MLFFIKSLLITLVTVAYSLAVMAAMLFGGKKVFSRFANSWSKALLRIAGVKVSMKGMERLEHGRSYVFAANHSSLFDIPVLLAGLGRDARIIYKKELEKIPVFGWGLRMSSFIGIIREEPRKALQSIDEAILSLDSGASIIVFPEGTRSKDGLLQPFKRGAFMIAARAGRPVVPVTIKGTSSILPKKQFRFQSGMVEVHIGKPLELAGNDRKEEAALMERVHSAIENRMDER